MTTSLERLASRYDPKLPDTAMIAIPEGNGDLRWLSEAVRTGALAQQMPIRAPGDDQLSLLWNAIVENTKGDGFWIGEILLSVLEREVGFNPAALNTGDGK